MGAKRLPREIRAEVLLRVEALIPSYTDDEGEIDVRSLVGGLEKALIRDDITLYRNLQNIAVRTVLDSLVADRFRDQTVPIKVGGRERKIRMFYRVPGENGQKVAKEVTDLTDEDFAYLEKYYFQEAFSRLNQARTLRSVHASVKSDTVQLGMG
jgi:hypothetical protein